MSSNPDFPFFFLTAFYNAKKKPFQKPFGQILPSDKLDLISTDRSFKADNKKSVHLIKINNQKLKQRHTGEGMHMSCLKNPCESEINSL